MEDNDDCSAFAAILREAEKVAVASTINFRVGDRVG